MLFVLTGAQFLPASSFYVAVLFVLKGAQFVPTFSLYVSALFVLTGAPVGVRVLPLRLHRGGQLLCAGRHTTFRQRP